MYDCDLGGLIVVLVLCHCVNTTEAKTKMACSVEEVGCKADASVEY